MITVKYKSTSLDTITNQQALSLKSYNKLTFNDGNLKMIESYYDGKMRLRKIVSYYLDDSELKENIINQYCIIEDSSSCIIYSNKQTSGLYKLWDCEVYNVEGVLKFKSKKAFDEKDRTIAIIDYEMDTMLVKKGIKYYYGNVYDNPHKDELLMFEYDTVSEELKLVTDSNENFGYHKPIYSDTFLADPEIFQALFVWDNQPYYHNLFPLLPQSPIL